MADKYLNKTVLKYFYDRIKTLFENKIEKIRVNNVEQSIVNKEAYITVDKIDLSRADEWVKWTHVTTEGDYDASLTKTQTGATFAIDEVGSVDLASKYYVDNNAGKIDKIKVNGIEQTITNKEVDIEVPTLLVGDGLAKISNQSDNSFEFSPLQAGLEYTSKINNVTDTNVVLASKPYVDNNFRTEAQVQEAIDAALADITGIDFQVVDTLPATGEKGVIYLLPNAGSSPNIYDEYIWVTPEGGTAHYEKIGSTDVDLSNYWTMTAGHENSLVAITTAEIDEIIG